MAHFFQNYLWFLKTLNINFQMYWLRYFCFWDPFISSFTVMVLWLSYKHCKSINFEVIGALSGKKLFLLWDDSELCLCTKKGLAVFKVRTLETKDSVLAICDRRDDSWAEVVKGRMQHIHNLPAVDVIYHLAV